MSETTQAASDTLFERTQYIRRLLNDATPGPYAVRLSPGADPEDGAYYISGAPDSRVVADNLSLSDAILITHLINYVPELLTEIEQVQRIVMSTGPEQALLNVVKQYQEKIGQLSGDPAPIPAAKTAADLSFLHVGCYLYVGGEPMGEDGMSEAWAYRILSVRQSGSALPVEVEVYPKDRVLLLLPDTPVTVLPISTNEGPQVAEGNAPKKDDAKE